ncbi:hypothetical protein CEXT_277791 [Caerostris extrusa]|uniref:Uncharacterized protein n=1 Tax=Caerostris extrusa TaxID=172846 RepID=A0AAV4TVE7_CAEEX|nr:hypothetical protein CEXT_277791 [Caerostris extrusa]
MIMKNNSRRNNEEELFSVDLPLIDDVLHKNKTASSAEKGVQSFMQLSSTHGQQDDDVKLFLEKKKLQPYTICFDVL